MTAGGPEAEARTFDVARQRIDEIEILRVRGELDMASAPRLGALVSEALRARPKGLVIDLGSVNFVDSTGLSVLLDARRRTRRQQIALKLACDVPSTLNLLSLMRLTADFEIYPTAAAALGSL